MGKKAQISIIMIMVVILLIIFGIAYYVTSSSREGKAEEELRTQQLGETKLGPVQEYVKSCLDLVSKNALETMGKQSGFLFKSQGGLTQDYLNSEIKTKFLIHDNLRVSYLIFEPAGELANLFTSSIPNYPWETFPYIRARTPSEEEWFSGFFGYNEMPPVEKEYTDSIQDQLETYTKNNIEECLDWETFEKQNLEIEKGEIKVETILAENTLVFNMKYPLIITDKVSGTKTNLEDFSVLYNIRLKKIFDFVEALMDRDVTDIRFDMAKATGADMNIKMIKDSSGTKDDIIIVTDFQSKIFNKPFEFRFARPNRNPALSYLFEEEITNNGDFGVCKGAVLSISEDGLNINNLDDCTSDDKFIQLSAYDPDEDELGFWIVVGAGDKISHTVKTTDFYQGNFKFDIKVKDGLKYDWQTIKLPIKALIT